MKLAKMLRISRGGVNSAVSRLFALAMFFNTALFCLPAGAETVQRNTENYINDNGYLEYTATADGETVEFNSGSPIVYGTTFTQNRATFNPFSSTAVLTILNQLSVSPQADGNRIQVPQGKTVFSGGLAASSAYAYNQYIMKTGNGVAEFSGPVAMNGGQFRNDTGTTIFSGESTTHSINDLRIQTSTSDRVVVNGTTANFTGGFHIGDTSGAIGRVYMTNSTVSIASDVNVGHVSGATASLEISGGTLSTASYASYFGKYAGSTGTFAVVNGGSVVSGGRINIGASSLEQNKAGGKGSLYVGNGGKITVNSNVYFGMDGGSADATFDSGNLIVNGSNLEFASSTAGCTEERDSKAVVAIKEGSAVTNTAPAGLLIFSREPGNYSRLSMSGGSLATSGANSTMVLGRNGKFRGTMTGGTISAAGEITFGRFATGSGRLDMYGGTLSLAGNHTKGIGYEGDGILTVGGNALFESAASVVLAQGNESAQIYGYGELNLSGNGVFYAPGITTSSAYGDRKVTADGGTFRVKGNGATVTYLDLTNDDSSVGPGGVTFDTGNNTATVLNFAADGNSSGQIRKTGIGTLVLDKLPRTHGGIAVQQGTLRLASGATVGAAYAPDADALAPDCDAELLHRWSFTAGSPVDSVGARTATIYGSVDNDRTGADADTISFPGGNTISVHYMDLGSGLFGTEDGEFTVEFWAKSSSWISANGKLLAVGNRKEDEFFFNADGMVRARADDNTGAVSAAYMEPRGQLAAGTQYHFSAVFSAPYATGRRSVVFRFNDTTTGATLAKQEHPNTPYSPVLHQDKFCFGAIPWHTDAGDCAMELDEVRIWKGALSEAQLEKNAKLGPDALPLVGIDATTGPVDVASGAAFDLGGNSISYGSLAGSGTVSNGTLAVTGELKTVGATVGADGVLDLTAATVTYDGPAPSGALVLARAENGGAIVGRPAAGSIPSGYTVSATANYVRLVKSGLMILIK